MAKCQECEDAQAKFPDPRSPPLDTDKCLCRGCAEAAFESAIYDANEEVLALQAQARKLGLKL